MRALLATALLAGAVFGMRSHPITERDLAFIRAGNKLGAGDIMLEQCHDTFCHQNCTMTHIPKDTCFSGQNAKFTCDKNAGGYCVALMRYNENATLGCSAPLGLAAVQCGKCQKDTDGTYSVIKNCHSFADATYNSQCDSTCTTCGRTTNLYRYTCVTNPETNWQWEALEYFPCDTLVSYSTFSTPACGGTPTNTYSFPAGACVSDLTGDQPQYNSWRYRCGA